MTAKQRKDEAREKLVWVILDDKKETWSSDVPNAIDAFAAACVAEALEPREQSPELAEAERWLRRKPLLPDGRPWDYAEKQALLIADELDRLRAENAALRSARARAARAGQTLPGVGDRVLVVSHGAVDRFVMTMVAKVGDSGFEVCGRIGLFPLEDEGVTWTRFGRRRLAPDATPATPPSAKAGT